MSKISTADCKAFLAAHDDPFLTRTERYATVLTRSAKWIRLRKYKDANGVVCRDFANTGIPAVVVLAETDQGLAVKRHRGLGKWEKAFETYFEAWEDNDPASIVDTWEEKMLWPSFRAEDFAFGFGVGGMMDDLNAHYYSFQPITCLGPNADGYDQHMAIDHLFPPHIGADQMCESTYAFSMNGADAANVTQDLIAVGFRHDASLNDMSGS
ncbi:MAG: hypothetical protein EON55_13330 [Alphaproteobacteria bacterium]|nr:MAG: hypothetical protein EON55_13330 [Alphaproteobacteria bacterium]